MVPALNNAMYAPGTPITPDNLKDVPFGTFTSINPFEEWTWGDDFTIFKDDKQTVEDDIEKELVKNKPITMESGDPWNI